MATPAVTVLMPVYNGARFLAGAMESVLGQTFGDFELLAINDGSSDQTAEILASSRDPRVRIVENGRNLGLIASLNKGLDLARGDYIARMDQDDICHPRRLAVQATFMRNRPEIGVVGAWYRPIGTGWVRAVRLPTSHEDICSWLPFHNPIAHPTAFLRRKVFVANRLYYDPSCLHAEDYDLWSRAARVTSLGNIPKALLRYRVHLDQITTQHGSAQSENAKLVRGRELAKLLPGITPGEIDFHHKLVTSNFTPDPSTFSRVESWLLRLHQENQRASAFPRASFDRAVGKVWLRASLDCMPHAWAYSRFACSPLTGLSGNRIASLTGFGARALKRVMSDKAA
jgi:hypothetical protein